MADDVAPALAENEIRIDIVEIDGPAEPVILATLSYHDPDDRNVVRETPTTENLVALLGFAKAVAAQNGSEISVRANDDFQWEEAWGELTSRSKEPGGKTIRFVVASSIADAPMDAIVEIMGGEDKVITVLRH